MLPHYDDEFGGDLDDEFEDEVLIAAGVAIALCMSSGMTATPEARTPKHNG